eukprot:4161684-Ditylum_brightwellii.AAC.1
MPLRPPWKSDFHGVSLKGYMKSWHTIWKGNENQEYPAMQVIGMIIKMELEAAGSHLDITLETELTALKRE